ncbi:prepilin peptidase [Thalassococcus lentus]|uniref:A24 family peptidase n=1 Tax=Thalassococcus lentus TaxID=1210524 RepID=A0ABT4XUH9_9RHOB|nr:A24 family peptidase [Thalassococcus lentus]MDA7425610.1 A24 family peptidase [Thalassococcus lentus]
MLASLYGLTGLVLRDQSAVLELVFAAMLAAPLIWLSLTDLHGQEIPDLAALGIVVVACIVLVSQSTPIVPHLVAGLAILALFWALGEVYFRAKGHEALGIGDAKLFGAGIFLLGPPFIPDLVLLSSLGGLLVGGVSTLRTGIQPKGIPFGPFIAYAIFILFFIDPIFL